MEEVNPAFHFNKVHWNGIGTAGDLPDAFIREQIRNSYLLVLRHRRHAPGPPRGRFCAISRNTVCPNNAETRDELPVFLVFWISKSCFLGGRRR